jgi:hypothetical protein
MKTRAYSKFFVIAALLLFCGALPAQSPREPYPGIDLLPAVKAATDFSIRFGSPKNVLVVFDIDNTLLKPEGTFLVSNQWYEWQKAICCAPPDAQTERYRVIKEAFDPAKEWGEKITPILRFLYEQLPQKTTDAKNPFIVGAMQSLGFPCMVMTSRGTDNRPATERELKRNSYDFSRTAPSSDRFPAMVDGSMNEYRFGVLMTSGGNKGKCLAYFINTLGPESDIKAVVFVDDDRKKTLDVINMPNDKQREIFALLYGFENDAIADFAANKGGIWTIVDKEWQALKPKYEQPRHGKTLRDNN